MPVPRKRHEQVARKEHHNRDRHAGRSG